MRYDGSTAGISNGGSSQRCPKELEGFFEFALQISVSPDII